MAMLQSPNQLQSAASCLPALDSLEILLSLLVAETSAQKTLARMPGIARWADLGPIQPEMGIVQLIRDTLHVAEITAGYFV
jgi:hypothetical protein